MKRSHACPTSHDPFRIKPALGPMPTDFPHAARCLLGLDIGTANARAYRAACQAGVVRGEPRPAALRYSLDGAVPAILEIDPVRGDVRSYGRTALDRFSTARDDKR